VILVEARVIRVKRTKDTGNGGDVIVEDSQQAECLYTLTGRDYLYAKDITALRALGFMVVISPENSNG
jgi:hypothetical protein